MEVTLRPCARVPGDGGGHEQHGDEQQAAAQEHGREEAVLAAADPVPDHPDEPQEGDAGERDQVQRDGHRGSPPRIGQPLAGHGGTGRDGEPEQHKRRDEEDGEDDPGDRGRPRSAQRTARLQRTLPCRYAGHVPPSLALSCDILLSDR